MGTIRIVGTARRRWKCKTRLIAERDVRGIYDITII